MAYVLNHDEWLAHQLGRVRGVLLVHMIDSQEYSGADLLSLLADYGLHYSAPEYTELGAALVSEGFLEIT